jgi:hypothetical protein
MLLEDVGRNEEGTHVADKRLGNAGQQLDRLTGHGLKIGATGKKNGLNGRGQGDRSLRPLTHLSVSRPTYNSGHCHLFPTDPVACFPDNDPALPGLGGVASSPGLGFSGLKPSGAMDFTSEFQTGDCSKGAIRSGAGPFPTIEMVGGPFTF